MKKSARITPIIIALLLCFTGIKAQSFDQIFDKYSEKEGVSSVYISKHMFELMSKMEQEDQEMKDIMYNLDNIRILAFEGSSFTAIDFEKEVIPMIPLDEYKELMVVREQNEKSAFYILEQAGRIKELLMIATSNGESILLSITGNIKLSQIARLSESMDIHGLDKLEEAETN